MNEPKTGCNDKMQKEFENDEKRTHTTTENKWKAETREQRPIKIQKQHIIADF